MQVLNQVISYFLVKMNPVFSKYIMFMTGIDHIIHLHTLLHTGFNEIHGMLLHHHGILESMDQ